MLYQLFGPDAFGRYLLKPVVAFIIIFSSILFFLGFDYILGAYVLGSIPSGYHLINRFLFKWFYREKSLEWRIFDALRGVTILDWFFFIVKVWLKLIVSFFIGAFSFPYVSYQLIKEIREVKESY